jgi:uncharacterized protein (DUF58 family)
MPTGRGVAVFGLSAALALSGWALGVEEFLLVALSAATLLSWATAAVHLETRRARKTLVARADEPGGEVSVGDQVSAAVRLRNTGRRSLALLGVEVPKPWSVSYPGLLRSPPARAARAVVVAEPAGRWRAVRTRAGSRRSLDVLRPGAQCTLASPIPTTKRGLWARPGLRVWCADPFGLVALPVGRVPGFEVVVVPRPASGATGAQDVGEHDAPARRAGGADVEGAVAPGGDEFAGLRPYVAGDRLTRLHWPALARSGDLLVRDFVEPMAALVEVVVDDRPGLVEESVLRAADLGCAWLRSGTGVVVATTSGERLVVPPGPTGRMSLLRALATVPAPS